MPMVQSRQLLLHIERAKVLTQHINTRLNTIVALPRRLMRKVDQAVPLTGTLGVELHLVVEAVKLEGSVVEVDDFVDKAFATKAGGVDCANGPIEGDGCAWREETVLAW